MALYAVGLCLAHFFVIAPAFTYLGFEKRPPNLLVAAIVAVPYLLCALRLPVSWERPSALLYWMLFLLVVAPVHVLPIFTSDIGQPMWVMVFSIAGAFWLLGFVFWFDAPELPKPQLSLRAYWIGYCVVWIVLLGLVISQYGLRLNFVEMSSVYDLRDAFRAASEEVPRVLRYPITWIGEVIAPVALGFGLYYRRYVVVGSAVLTQLLLVSITGYRSMLFSSLLVAAVVLIAKYSDIKRLGARIAALVTSGVLAVTALEYLLGTSQVSSLFIRRMILAAAVNTNYHFEYFSLYPQVHLAHSVLGPWLDYPYALPPANLIGLAYYDSAWTSANANLWADAFSNFGLLGVFGFTVVLGVVLFMVDGAAKRVPAPLALAAFVVPAVSLSNSAMLTVFLTHGFLLAGLVIYLMPRQSEESAVAEQRVLVLNHFALPRSIGGGTRHVELFGRVEGWQHTIVASNRNNYTRQTFSTDEPNFVTVPTPGHSSNGIGRVLGWLTYVLGALWVGIRQRGVVVVYASSPHLLAPFAGLMLARLRRAAFVLEIRDLWPRSMVELGYLAPGSALHRVLVGLEGFLYRKADRIVAVSGGWGEHFASFGVLADKVVVISNGAEPADFVPTKTKQQARADLGLDPDSFVSVYAGAHGPANGLDQVVDAAAKLPTHTFLFVGDGLDKPRLRERAADEGLSNVRFVDAVPKAELADLLVAADAGLHILADTALFHEGISSNKLYDYLACGLPAITNVRGEPADAITAARAGVACASGGLVDAVRELDQAGPDERAAMGARGRAYVEAHVSRTAMAERLGAVLREQAERVGR